jgi:hypothetical protein
MATKTKSELRYFSFFVGWLSVPPKLKPIALPTTTALLRLRPKGREVKRPLPGRGQSRAPALARAPERQGPLPQPRPGLLRCGRRCGHWCGGGQGLSGGGEEEAREGRAGPKRPAEKFRMELHAYVERVIRTRELHYLGGTEHDSVSRSVVVASPLVSQSFSVVPGAWEWI